MILLGFVCIIYCYIVVNCDVRLCLQISTIPKLKCLAVCKDFTRCLCPKQQMERWKWLSYYSTHQLKITMENLRMVIKMGLI